MIRLKNFLFLAILLIYTIETKCYADTITPVHAIQGSGSESLMISKICTVQGIVTGDFQQDNRLGGFFLQEEAWDADETTSEGIFVFYNRSDVKEGDIIRATGEVTEYNGLTELINITDIKVISSGNKLPDSAVLELPMKSSTFPERFEGMQVILPQKLTVSDNHDLAYYGSVILSNGRLMSPTQIAGPGTDANTLKSANMLNQIILDDGSYTVNPDPIPYPSPTGLIAENTLRTGYTVTGITGIMSYSFGAYRIHPTDPPKFDETSNPRPAKPDINARLKIASFNVLNYFNGPVFPTSRGADTSTEFARQRAKIINAIIVADADIIGLMEIENDGYGAESAIQDLVNGLNTASSSVAYAFINPGISRLGSDEIAVGMLYKKESVKPVGTTATKNDGAFSEHNRQPLAQTFRDIRSGEEFTLVVNHFKAKGSSCPDDPDMNDGQGNCNLTRTAAAKELTAWLSTYPTGVNDPDILIIGDLNSYAMEDPVAVIEDAGYTNLIKQKTGDTAYSYIYEGEAGYLDHALASKSLVSQVKNIAEWHINADEPAILDYNEENKTEAQKVNFYSDKPFRSSDHDPILIGVDLYSQKNNADLDHAIAILKILAGIKNVAYSGTDIYQDGIIGFEELIYILQVVSGMRS